MKKLTSKITLFALSIATASATFVQSTPASAAEGVILIENGAPLAKIYISPSELTATDPPAGKKKPVTRSVLRDEVEDLNYHFEQMSGAKLEVVPTDDAAQVKTPAIVIGSLAAKMGATPKETKFRDGFRIVSRDGRVLLAGENPFATSHAVYALLKQQGCDWVMPGKLGEIIPQKKTIGVLAQDKSDAPDFGTRRFWYRGGPTIATGPERAEYEQWTRRQRLGIPEALRLNVGGHIWNQIIKMYKDRFDADPTMLALVRKPDGTLVRQGPQFESTNPKVVEATADYIRSIYAKNGWAKDADVTISISPADGGGYSISPETVAANSGRIDPISGGPDYSDIVAKLANDVLNVVGNEFPGLHLSYLIYSVHADFPKKYKPNPRISPTFAPISYSRLHSTTDPHSKTRAYYNRVLQEWSALAKEQGNRLSVYEYNWNLADNMLPFTRVEMLGEDIPYYHKLGISGFILESTKAWAINGAHDYIAARLVWDASQDWKMLLHEYSMKTFGAAAPMMERYYLRLADLQSRKGQEAGSFYAAPQIFDAAFIAASQDDFKAALAQQLSPEQRIRTEAATLPLEVLRHFLDWSQAQNAYDFPRAKAALDATLAAWQKQLDLNGQFAAREVPSYIKRLSLSTEQLLQYSSAPYQRVFEFPDALPTALDPTGQGDELNFQAPEISDEQWMKTRTFGTTWDAQGLGFYREGAVWYRVHFTLPQTADKQPVGLVLGGFDDEARVWLNGKALGSSGRKFSRPAVFDLTDAVKYGGENVLAIQIIRNSQFNENLTGGLMAPSFLFTGPRVVASTKPSDPEYRVLPGGETEPAGK
jgi:hypothetical protein